MESLQLPQDLYWDGKMEPSSPSSELFSLSNSEEVWLFEDNFAKEILRIKDDILDDQCKLPIEGELLLEFEYDVKQEQWVDGKIHGGGFPLMEYTADIVPQPTTAQKVQDSYELLVELEKIYSGAELTQLTPPQTPPQSYNSEVKPDFTMFQQHQQNHCSEVATNQIVEDIIPALSPASSNTDYSSDPCSSPVSPDIAREMQIVDDILRARAKDIPDWTDDENSMYSMSSSSVSQSNDDEWSPSSASSSSSTSGKILASSTTKKRPRPYGRGVEDKKSRKKEQNKNAATRYRQKKKQEMEEILEEERILAKKNEELSKTVTDIQREVKYLKQLIREFHRSRSS